MADRTWEYITPCCWLPAAWAKRGFGLQKVRRSLLTSLESVKDGGEVIWARPPMLTLAQGTHIGESLVCDSPVSRTILLEIS